MSWSEAEGDPLKTYRQYCPIARASEILAERWTPLVIRNLMFGVDTFAEIARGVPAMSRSLLIKRLGELERAGIITTSPKENGHGRRYELTAAGRDLAGVMTQMAEWGTRWLDIAPDHCDPGMALWAWCVVQMNTAALPQRRTVVAFEFPEEAARNRRYWLLVEGGEAELCFTDPGGEPDLYVRASSMAFVRWHAGTLAWAAAVRDGAIEVRGDRDLARALPTWNTHLPAMAV